MPAPTSVVTGGCTGGGGKPPPYGVEPIGMWMPAPTSVVTGECTGGGGKPPPYGVESIGLWMTVPMLMVTGECTGGGAVRPSRATKNRLLSAESSRETYVNYRAFLATSTREAKAAASVMASSLRALRFISTPAFFRPYMKRE